MYFEFCELESTVFTEWMCIVTPAVHLNKISNLKRLSERGVLAYLKIIGMAQFFCLFVCLFEDGVFSSPDCLASTELPM